MQQGEELKRIIDADDIRWYYYTYSSEKGERFANAMRKLIEKAGLIDAPPESLDELTEKIENLTKQFDTIPSRKPRNRFSTTISEEDTYAFLAHDPVIGKLNPLAPPLSMRVEDDKIVGEVNFNSAYEGPPQCAHGGYIAAVFDILLGGTEALSGIPGVTGTLSVRYIAPTPLNTDLRVEGILEGVEGRKILTKGTMYHGDTPTAEATGIFISFI
jgi:acyl-coenzyme A thioesterase PaaI-like protein